MRDHKKIKRQKLFSIINSSLDCRLHNSILSTIGTRVGHRQLVMHFVSYHYKVTRFYFQHTSGIDTAVGYSNTLTQNISSVKLLTHGVTYSD
jgi:hypothetical protein